MADEKQVIVSDRAQGVIRDMHTKVAQLGAHFGETSPEYTKAAASLAKVLSTIFAMGFGDTAHVGRDGDLSLHVTEGQFVYGIVWFRDRNYDAQLMVPQPGEWSVHS